MAQRTDEANQLRVQNRALYEENARLTDLARTLLSSPNFSQFLDEMNTNGLPSGQAQLSQQPQQSQPQVQQQQVQQPQPPAMSQAPMQQGNIPKEPAANHGQQEFQMQQQNSQMGMMMVPSQGLDVSSMNMNNGGWNTGIDVNFSNAPVFAVLEVPEPPVDTEILSGKSTGLDGLNYAEAPSTTKDAPLADRFPEEQPTVDAGDLNVEVDESDPVLALFADQPKQSVSQISEDSSFYGIESSKPPAYEIVVESDSKADANRLASLCSSMEDAFQRVSMLTAHLQ